MGSALNIGRGNRRRGDGTSLRLRSRFCHILDDGTPATAAFVAGSARYPAPRACHARSGGLTSSALLRTIHPSGGGSFARRRASVLHRPTGDVFQWLVSALLAIDLASASSSVFRLPARSLPVARAATVPPARRISA